MSDRVHYRFTRFSNIILLLFVICGLGRDGAQAQGPLPESQAANHYFTIRVVDRQTQRGVPLVELRTVNSIRYFTDSQGVIAFDEPGLMDRDVFFFVESHGYTFPKDGFGMQGRRLKTRPGHTEVLEIDRVNLAERLYRVTGQGIYRDSLLAGLPVPASAEFPSLVPYLQGPPPTPEPVFSEIDYGLWHYRLGHRCVMVRHKNHKLFLYRDPVDKTRFTPAEADPCLFDLSADPNERHNLANDPSCTPILTDLLHQIDTWDRSRPIREPTLTGRFGGQPRK